MKTNKYIVLIVGLIVLSGCGQQVNSKRKTTSSLSQASGSITDTTISQSLPLAMGAAPAAIARSSTSAEYVASLTTEQKKLLFSNWSNANTGMTLILSGLDQVTGSGTLYFSLLNSSSVKACAASAAIAIDKRTTSTNIFGNITINGGQSYYWSGNNLLLKNDSECSVFTGRFDFIASASGFYVEDRTKTLAEQTPLYHSSASPEQLGPYFYKWYNSSSLIVDLSGISKIGAATHNFTGSDGSQCQSIMAIGGRDGFVTINILEGADLSGKVTSACSVRNGAYKLQKINTNTLTIKGLNGSALNVLPEAMTLTNSLPTNPTPTNPTPTTPAPTDSPVAVSWSSQEQIVWKNIQAKNAFDTILNQANVYLTNERNKAIAAMNAAVSAPGSVAPATATSSLRALFTKLSAADAAMTTWKNVTKGGNWSSIDPGYKELQTAIDVAYRDALNAVKAGVSGGSSVTWTPFELTSWKSIKAQIVYDNSMALANAYVASERNRANAAYNAVMSSPTSSAPSVATMALKNAVAKNASAVAAMDYWKNVTKGGNWSSTEQAYKELQATIDLTFNEAFLLAIPR